MLIKCKMQDNLEFLQWTKRFWDQYYPGGDYDALARRKASGPPGSNAPSAAPAPVRTSGAAAARRGTTPTPTAASKASRTTGGSAHLSHENAQLKETVTGLERERDFYFSKLRDIELLIQQAIELDPKIEEDEEGLVKQIQSILYSTEVSFRFGWLHMAVSLTIALQEGFEIPAETEGAGDDLETF
jgi:RP/EB family microtubule-associated protein